MEIVQEERPSVEVLRNRFKGLAPQISRTNRPHTAQRGPSIARTAEDGSEGRHGVNTASPAVPMAPISSAAPVLSRPAGHSFRSERGGLSDTAITLLEDYAA